jgi:Asp-tRNA(Asn)/Glu-tRNA(Gln) amidotransferase A subunit family amidase
MTATRRQILQGLAAAGVGTVVFQRALVAQVQPQTGGVTPEMIQQAEWISGIKLTDLERTAVSRAFSQTVRAFETIRGVKIDNGVPPAVVFDPAPWLPPATPGDRGRVEPTSIEPPKRPDNGDDLAFLPLTALAALVRTRQVSSAELTRLYLDRLHKYDAVLKCVVSFTDDLALKLAERADREIAAGRYRGPLHGIPWGAKDLIAYPGYKTTWGAAPFKEQTIDVKATVAQRLEDAGAVLVAKTTMGALAQGDRWFGGMTRSPWNSSQGSSGSSAGSASTTAAGLVGFAIGTETRGSIISPCTQCHVTGLRPTFGRISRYGCMALSWSMDKLGPIARSVEDCALVFGAIHGFDGFDPCAVDRPFVWPAKRDFKSLKAGYFEPGAQGQRGGRGGGFGTTSEATLKVLRDLGVQLVPIKLPTKYPVNEIGFILTVEAAAAFDDLTRRGVSEGLNSWAQSFRQMEFVPAVEYIRANRIRTLVMQEMEQVMSQVDLYVGGNDVGLTNLTGHPTVVVPNGFRSTDNGEVPMSLTFTGQLYGETEILSVAKAYQDATGHHLKRPAKRVRPESPSQHSRRRRSAENRGRCSGTLASCGPVPTSAESSRADR